VKKKRGWSRKMPVEDIIQSLGEVVGFVTVMKARTDSTFIEATHGKKSKCFISNEGFGSAENIVTRCIDG
jgi:hypothetical protein